MEVETHFQPDDGPLQALYSTMAREEFEAIERTIADPEAGSIVYEARTKSGRPRMMVFRVSRIVAFQEAK